MTNTDTISVRGREIRTIKNRDGKEERERLQQALLEDQKEVNALAERLGRRPRAAVVTFGCQMNARDSEKLQGILDAAGYENTKDEEAADLVLYNTCTVRDNADKRVLGRIGRLSGYKKKKPWLRIILCGCMMQEQAAVDKIRKSYPFVDLVFGTYNLYTFPELLQTMYASDRMVISIWEETKEVLEDLPVTRKYPFKSGVNIMYGCNNFCTFCIVPYVRGRERSRDPFDIIREVERLAADGVKEVMLLGQNVNSYGKDQKGAYPSFPELLRQVCQVPGIGRVRFMSSNPQDFSDELIEVIRTQPKVARHVHLAVQSGSDRILKKMNRRHTREQFLNLVGRIRSISPDIAITTDIIVGFPGETDKDVDDTIDLVKRAHFDNAFTFIYSKRTGTPAAKMEQVLTKEEIQSNFDRLLKAVQEEAKSQTGKHTGQTKEVLVEGVNDHDPALLTGRLSNNTLVHFPGDKALIGSFVNVHLDKAHGFYYTGTLV